MGAPHSSSRRAVLATLGTLTAGSLAGCAGAGAEPRIEVPEVAPLDRPVEPAIEGIGVEQVLVTAETTPPGGDWTWAAEATFEVEDGRVDLAEDAPVEGDYEGADPMGLFQAMESEQSLRDPHTLERQGVSEEPSPESVRSTRAGAASPSPTPPR